VSGRFRLNTGLYLAPTPGGAYYAAHRPDPEPARVLLWRLMRCDETPALELDRVRAWLPTKTDETILELLFRMQGIAWIQGEVEPRRSPQGTLEDVLPQLLAHLSSQRRALLADNAGFYVATHGYTHEACEELSALSADLGSLYERHGQLIHNNLAIGSAAWSIVDAAGNSQIGFWPLHIGREHFVLVLSGVPRLNQPAFTDLIWALAKRYADSVEIMESVPAGEALEAMASP
jgi:hypothetical protein